MKIFITKEQNITSEKDFFTLFFTNKGKVLTFKYANYYFNQNSNFLLFQLYSASANLNSSKKPTLKGSLTTNLCGKKLFV